MPRTLLITRFFCTVLMIPCSYSCQIPTEVDPVSICGFCSESSTGIRLMLHSNIIEQNVHSIDIKFHCDMLDNEKYDHDDCFDGRKFTGVSNIETGVWRWYILERRFQVGTNCTFTAEYEDEFGFPSTELQTSCTIREKNASVCSVTPDSMCSGELGDSECSCDCGQGFITNATNVGIHCTNVDECSSGGHICNSENDCVDTEGSYWCNQTMSYGGSENQSIPVEDLPPLSDRPCSSIDGTQTIPRETEQLISTLNSKSDTSKITTIADNSTFSIASKGEINSIIVIALTTIPALTLSALFVVLTAIALKRYLSKLEETKKGYEQFDPEYNPVAIEQITATKISLDSILNSLHDIDMHITNESNSGVKNLETESCTSDVTCALEQTGLRGDGEQSSTCSQVLDGTTAELQSTIVVDMTTTKHKCIAIDQQTSISASYQPQTSSDTECIQLAIDLDSNLNLYQKKSSCQPHRNNFSITTPVYFEFPQFKK